MCFYFSMGDSGNDTCSFGSEGTASTLCFSPVPSPPTPLLELHLSPIRPGACSTPLLPDLEVNLSPSSKPPGLSSPNPENTDSNSSLTSSVLGFYCEICQARAVSMLTLFDQEFDDQVFLRDLDRDTWIKCDRCNTCYHQTCWELHDESPITGRFICCKYTPTACLLNFTHALLFWCWYM